MKFFYLFIYNKYKVIMETHKFFEDDELKKVNEEHDCVVIDFDVSIDGKKYIEISSLMDDIDETDRQQCREKLGNGSKLLQFAMHQYYLYIVKKHSDTIKKEEIAFYLDDVAKINLTSKNLTKQLNNYTLSAITLVKRDTYFYEKYGFLYPIKDDNPHKLSLVDSYNKIYIPGRRAVLETPIYKYIPDMNIRTPYQLSQIITQIMGTYLSAVNGKGVRIPIEADDFVDSMIDELKKAIKIWEPQFYLVNYFNELKTEKYAQNTIKETWESEINDNYAKLYIIIFTIISILEKKINKELGLIDDMDDVRNYKIYPFIKIISKLQNEDDIKKLFDDLTKLAEYNILPVNELFIHVFNEKMTELGIKLSEELNTQYEKFITVNTPPKSNGSIATGGAKLPPHTQDDDEVDKLETTYGQINFFTSKTQEPSQTGGKVKNSISKQKKDKTKKKNVEKQEGNKKKKQNKKTIKTTKITKKNSFKVINNRDKKEKRKTLKLTRKRKNKY
jgi:hypothetical protein